MTGIGRARRDFHKEQGRKLNVMSDEEGVMEGMAGTGLAWLNGRSHGELPRRRDGHRANVEGLSQGAVFEDDGRCHM